MLSMVDLHVSVIKLVNDHDDEVGFFSSTGFLTMRPEEGLVLVLLL